MAGRVRDSEAGFGLVELMVVMVLLGIVGGIASRSVITGMQAQRRQIDRVEALAGARLGAERMMRDLRMANPLGGPLDGNAATMDVERGGTDRRMRFAAVDSAGDWVLQVEETALDAAGNPTGPPTVRVLVRGLAPPAPSTFTYRDASGAALGSSAAPALVASIEVHLAVQAREQTPVALDDRVTLRNRGSS